jgi:hypothetical protein
VSEEDRWISVTTAVVRDAMLEVETLLGCGAQEESRPEHV